MELLATIIMSMCMFEGWGNRFTVVDDSPLAAAFFNVCDDAILFLLYVICGIPCHKMLSVINISFHHQRYKPHDMHVHVWDGGGGLGLHWWVTSLLLHAAWLKYVKLLYYFCCMLLVC